MKRARQFKDVHIRSSYSSQSDNGGGCVLTSGDHMINAIMDPQHVTKYQHSLEQKR